MSTNQVCGTGVSSCHGHHGGRNRHIHPGAAGSFEEVWKGACHAQERAGEAPANNETNLRTSKMKEVSLNDPWPEDHPLREKCDEFLGLFKEAFTKALSEKGLADDSANCDTVIISRADMDEVCRDMIKDLATNPRAASLMAELRIDFTMDGDMSMMPEEEAMQLYGALRETVIDERGVIDFAAYKRNAQRAVSLGLESMASAVAELGHTRLVLPYSFAPNQRPDYPGEEAGRDEMNAFQKKINSYEYEYYKLMKQAENEVLADLGLSPLDYAPDDPKNLEAVRLVGQKLMDNPRARELMAGLGLTSVNQFGLPTAAGLEDMDTMELDGERLTGLPGYSEDEWFNGLKGSIGTARKEVPMGRDYVTLYHIFKSLPHQPQVSIEAQLLERNFSLAAFMQ